MALNPTFKIFSLPFDVDYEEVQLQLQMELIDLQCSEDLKSKFLACHIFDFDMNHVLLSGQFLNLITHTQQIVSMLALHIAMNRHSPKWIPRICCVCNCRMYYCQPLHLTLYTFFVIANIKCLKSWLLAYYQIKLVFFWGVFCLFKIVASNSKLCGPWAEKVEDPCSTVTQTREKLADQWYQISILTECLILQIRYFM